MKFRKPHFRFQFFRLCQDSIHLDGGPIFIPPYCRHPSLPPRTVSRGRARRRRLVPGVCGPSAEGVEGRKKWADPADLHVWLCRVSNRISIPLQEEVSTNYKCNPPTGRVGATKRINYTLPTRVMQLPVWAGVLNIKLKLYVV